MLITSNTTPFLAELFVPTDKHARKHCVVVVKATFDVALNAKCRPSPDQLPFVYVDVHRGDPGTTSVKNECEFVPTKPRCDVLIDAYATTPDKRPLTMLEVALLGPHIKKHAIVTGDRVWTKGVVGFKPSRPQPFTTMELAWDRAFGGSDSSSKNVARTGSELRNPVGVGFHLNANEPSIGGQPLPNIENPGQRVTASSDKPEPIGFAPVGRGWLPRSRFAGTYDQRWMDDKRPFLPDDFDERYFQSAPLDQQLVRLSDGMAFECVNMSASGRFSVRLPSLQVPVRFMFDDRIDTRTLAPDTLILKPAEGRIVLLGRVSVPLTRKLVALREVQVGQPRHRPPRSKLYYSRLSAAVTAAVSRR
jgi:hypothetical protein